MRKMIIAAVALIGAAFAAPANAQLAKPGLAAEAPGLVQQTQYYGYRYHHSRPHHRHRYRHCYNTRVRVHGYHGRSYWTTRRVCTWRYR